MRLRTRGQGAIVPTLNPNMVKMLFLPILPSLLPRDPRTDGLIREPCEQRMNRGEWVVFDGRKERELRGRELKQRYEELPYYGLVLPGAQSATDRLRFRVSFVVVLSILNPTLPGSV